FFSLVAVRVIVFLKQRRDAVTLFLRVERACGKILDVNLSRVHRPQSWADVSLIVEPRSHPQQITARHKLARHFRMGRRERLKHVKQVSIPNRPRHEDETERQREDSRLKSRFTELAQTRNHQSETDGCGKETAIRTKKDRGACEQTSDDPPHKRSFPHRRLERKRRGEHHRNGEKVCRYFSEDRRNVDRRERAYGG